MTSSILFDAFDERIDIRRPSVRCNKVAIFSLTFSMTLSASLLVMMNEENVNNGAWINESSELAMPRRVANASDLSVKLSRCLNSCSSEYD